MRASHPKINLELGKKSFEQVRDAKKPEWAWNILSRFTPYVKTVPVPIEELKAIVNNRSRWKEAHKQFTKIRVFGLENRNFQPESYLLLAEKVAKITYNASNEPAPFDHDSGWYIRDLALITAKYFNNQELQYEVAKDIESNT